jgi:hypothetical protein
MAEHLESRADEDTGRRVSLREAHLIKQVTLALLWCNFFLWSATLLAIDNDSLWGSVPPQLGLSDELAREMVMCGPNSLYVLLRLYKVDIDFREILRESTWHPRGMSLLEMANIARAADFKCMVRRCTAGELCNSFRGPVVARVVPWDGNQNSAHYIVITAIVNGRLSAIDGSSGQLLSLNPQKLDGGLWLGEILVPSVQYGPSSAVDSSYILLIVVPWIFLAAFAARFCRRWAPSPSP